MVDSSKCTPNLSSRQKVIFGQDFNEGLVRQVIDAYRQFSVSKLSHIFAALTISDIARKTSPAPNNFQETASYIQRLISTGKLNATISNKSGEHKTWIVRFSESTSGPLARSEEQQHEDLIKQTRRVKVLIDHIRETDRKLGLSKDYINDAKKKRKTDGGGPDEGGWTPYDHDEDMMGD